MRIAQLSDIHISADCGHPRGIDVRANFSSVLSEVRRGEYDLLVLSGDLALDEGHVDAYPWIAAQIAGLPMPVLVMAGNHDDVTCMVVDFGLEQQFVDGQLRWKRTLDGIAVYGLDTSSGALAEDQIAWLESGVVRDGQRPIVFLHHPPLDCGCRFGDRHTPLLNRDDVWRRLAGIPGVDVIFCGHYHTHKVVERDGVRVVLCPSTELQISQDSERFQVEHERPGYLEIRIEPDRVAWDTHYLAAGSRVAAGPARD